MGALRVRATTTPLALRLRLICCVHRRPPSARLRYEHRRPVGAVAPCPTLYHNGKQFIRVPHNASRHESHGLLARGSLRAPWTPLRPRFARGRGCATPRQHDRQGPRHQAGVGALVCRPSLRSPRRPCRGREPQAPPARPPSGHPSVPPRRHSLPTARSERRHAPRASQPGGPRPCRSESCRPQAVRRARLRPCSEPQRRPPPRLRSPCRTAPAPPAAVPAARPCAVRLSSPGCPPSRLFHARVSSNPVYGGLTLSSIDAPA